MSGFFNMDNAVMRFLSKVFDVMFLSLLWFIFSIPVVTMGAATTAMYYAAVKVIRRDRGYVFREFWKSFRMNFGGATAVWIIELVIGFLFYNNLHFAMALTNTTGKVLFCLYWAMIFIVAITTVYLYPVLSRFAIRTPKLVKTSLLMSIKHLPSTVVMLAIVIACVLGCALQPLGLFVLPACGALLISLLMERILKLYTPKAEDEAGKDEWYLE